MWLKNWVSVPEQCFSISQQWCLGLKWFRRNASWMHSTKDKVTENVFLWKGTNLLRTCFKQCQEWRDLNKNLKSTVLFQNALLIIYIMYAQDTEPAGNSILCESLPFPNASFFLLLFWWLNLCLHYLLPLLLSSACQSTIHCHAVPVTMWPLWCSQSTIPVSYTHLTLPTNHRV